jgi:hypothetical protein
VLDRDRGMFDARGSVGDAAEGCEGDGDGDRGCDERHAKSPGRHVKPVRFDVGDDLVDQLVLR